jgi:regulatory protein
VDVEYAIEKYYPKILNFVALRARSKKETEDRLKKYLQFSDMGTDENEAVLTAIISRLETDRFIGDEKFAQDFVSSVFHSSKPRGKQYVMRYLMQKGVKKSFIEEALSKVDPDIEFNSALAAAEKRARIQKSKNEYDAKRKLYAHLVGKGFSSNIIGRVIDIVLGVK